jgi:hypothetical protein
MEIDQSTISKIMQDVSEEGFSFLKNEETIKLAEAARNEYFSLFQQYKLSGKGFQYRDLLKSPIRKKNISSSNGLGEAYAQVLQTTYFHEAFHNQALSPVFNLLIALRNKITSSPDDFGCNPSRDGMWNACRIHHYPRGGGFMASHRDTYFPAVLGERGFIQIFHLLSKKGEDFDEGGGLIVDLNGRQIDIEAEAGFGTLVFFDGRIIHGVADVDRTEDFSFDNKNGRLVAIANLYEYQENNES